MGSKMLGSLMHVKLDHASDVGQVVKQRAMPLHHPLCGMVTERCIADVNIRIRQSAANLSRMWFSMGLLSGKSKELYIMPRVQMSVSVLVCLYPKDPFVSPKIPFHGRKTCQRG
jgi:hypothetical protein